MFADSTSSVIYKTLNDGSAIAINIIAGKIVQIISIAVPCDISLMLIILGLLIALYDMIAAMMHTSPIVSTNQ